MLRRPLAGYLLALALVAAVGAWLYPPRVASFEQGIYHADEGAWVAAGDYYFQALFVRGDTSAETWESDPYGPWSTAAPPVGKYVIGLGVGLTGEGGAHSEPPQWYDHSRSYAENVAAGSAPAPGALLGARRVVALLAMLSALLVTTLGGWLFRRPWAAALAGLLFLFDPLTRYSGQRAMVDIPALFFSLLALVTALWVGVALHRERYRAALAWAAFTGVACGLAVGTKQNALLVPVMLLLWLALWAARRPRGPSVRSLVALAGVGGAAALLTFVLLNPFLYRDPLGHTLRLLQTGGEVAAFDVPEPFRLDTLPKRVEGMVIMGLVETGPLYRTLPTLPWGCLEARCVPEIYVWGRPIPEGALSQGPWWDVILAALGLAWLLGAAWRQRRSAWAPAPYALAWIALTVAGTLAWVPFAWERWFLPLEPAWALLMTAGVVAPVELLTRLRR